VATNEKPSITVHFGPEQGRTQRIKGFIPPPPQNAKSGLSNNAEYVANLDKQLSYRRGTARRLKSVEILSAAAQLYEKSHLTRRIALSCGIKISPVGSLD